MGGSRGSSEIHCTELTTCYCEYSTRVKPTILNLFIFTPKDKEWLVKVDALKTFDDVLTLAKEMLGSVRGKYQTVPIPGAETTLDHSRLLTEAVAEKADLVEKLRTDLEMTSKEKVLERETKEKDNKRAGAANDPMFIYIG